MKSLTAGPSATRTRRARNRRIRSLVLCSSVLTLTWLSACGGQDGNDLWNAPGGSSSGGVSTGGKAGLGGAPPAAGDGGANGGSGAAGGNPSDPLGGGPSTGGSAKGGSSGSGAGGKLHSGGRGSGGSSAGSPNRNGGQAGSDGGSGGTSGAPMLGGQGGEAGTIGLAGSAGAAGQANCGTLLADVGTRLEQAQRCDPNPGPPPCQGFVADECGCRQPVDRDDSPASIEYARAVESYKTSCEIHCPFACPEPIEATCNATASEKPGVCVVSTAL